MWAAHEEIMPTDLTGVFRKKNATIRVFGFCFLRIKITKLLLKRVSTKIVIFLIAGAHHPTSYGMVVKDVNFSCHISKSLLTLF